MANSTPSVRTTALQAMAACRPGAIAGCIKSKLVTLHVLCQVGFGCGGSKEC